MNTETNQEIEEIEETEELAEIAEIDPVRLRMFRDRLRDDQNLPAGIAAGVGAAVVSAGVWALITTVSGYQIGFMAIGVGYLVGYAVGKAGKGIDNHFGIVGATLALAGCLLGNLLVACSVVSKEFGIPLMSVITSLNLEKVGILMTATFSPIDLLFYGLAVHGGWRMSFRRIRKEEIEELATT